MLLVFDLQYGVPLIARILGDHNCIRDNVALLYVLWYSIDEHQPQMEEPFMGIYLNPGNSGFIDIKQRNYVDKTGLIAQINKTIGTSDKLTCISRPRRFGKSFAAQMLCAYYDKTCNSAALFDDLAVAKSPDYQAHLNRYDVIYIDMAGVKPSADNFRSLVPFLKERLTEEIVQAYPGVSASSDFPSTLVNAVECAGNRFIAIIDEWDAPIREAPEMQKEYLEFLRSLFKNSGITSRVFAAAYMTGILPIKKDGSQSAISDFQEYTMVSPSHFAEYVGFTESEVRDICVRENADFASMKQWYDGYAFDGVGSVYNPNSVMRAVRNQRFRSYWTETSAADNLMDYISRDEKGLGRTVAEIIGGIEKSVDTNGFSNDLITFHNQDDVLTLLIHLGYLAYNEDTGCVRIPNEEIRLEFARAIHDDKRPETMRRIRESEQLFLDTIHMNEEAVAAQIEKVHTQETSPLHAHNEQTLRAVLQLAYFSYKDNYLKLEELPSGKGYADIVYLPKKNSNMPVLVIEIKWGSSAENAIEQIRNRNYPAALKNFGGEILLVGISYNKNAPIGKRKYTCRIEKVLL